MICRHCLRRSFAQPPLRSPARSSVKLDAPTLSRCLNTTTGTPTKPGPPAATSTSAAQPFSTPLTPAPEISRQKSSDPPIPASSVPAGTPLKGLAYIKNRPDPVAEEESAYPAWLWQCLGEGGKASGSKDAQAEEGDEGDLFSKSKKQRRLAAKRLRKATTQDPDGLARHVPLEEQSVDLPANENGTLEGALEAGTRREELTHRLRQKRRASIKEANFLKGMR